MNKPAEDGGSSSSKVISVVFVLLLLDLLGFTLILPLLPSILDHYAQTGVGGFFRHVLEQMCISHTKKCENYD